jgi:hypothetical protein
VAVLDWRAAVQLKENLRFIERARAEGRVRPREWRAGAAKFRSLTLREDGSCELQRFSPAAVSRRLGGVIARRAGARKGKDERG